MTADEYISTYGSNLSEADQRYIRAFGPPTVANPGAARNPYTPTLRSPVVPFSQQPRRRRDR